MLTGRSCSGQVNDEVLKRKEQRNQRLVDLEERISHFQSKVDDEKQTNTCWQKIWTEIVDNGKQKPVGDTWKKFFDGLAGTTLSAVPVFFESDEQAMPRSKMMMMLGVHVSNIQSSLDQNQKLLQGAEKRAAACRALEKTIEERARKKILILADDDAREKKINAEKIFGCTQ